MKAKRAQMTVAASKRRRKKKKSRSICILYEAINGVRFISDNFASFCRFISSENINK